MDKLFINLYYLISKWKKTFFLAVLLFFGASLYIASHLSFDEDITRILPKGEKSDKVAKIIGQLNFSDKITVMISAKDATSKGKLGEVARAFLDSLANDSTYYTEIQGQVDASKIDETFSFVHENIPLFLEDEDYQILEKRLTADSIQQRIHDNYTTLISPTGMVLRDFILKDPLGISIIGLNKLRELGVSKEFILHDGFITTADTSTLLLFITPAFSGTDTKANEAFVRHLYFYQDELNAANQGEIEVSYYGAPFIALANAEQIKTDIQSTVVLSIIVLMLILILFYKKIFIPLILFLPAILGAGFALAVLYFISPTISAISVSVGAILLGVTLDYAIHVITHYREHTDIRVMYRTITKPLLGCSLTTSFAFLCLILVKSQVLRDLGIFAAISILTAAIFALILIPHIYTPKLVAKTSLIDKLGAHSFEKNKVLIGLTVVVVLLGLYSFSKVRFNDNIADLNFVPENMKAAEKQLETLGSIGAKSIYLTAYGDDEQAILAKNTVVERQLKSLKDAQKIEDYNSIGNVVLSEVEQQEKINNWNQFWTQERIDFVVNQVNETALKLGFNETAFNALEELLSTSFSPISVAEYQELDVLPLDEYLIEKEGFITLSTIVKTDAAHYNEVVQALEQEDVAVIDRKHLNEQFLGQMKDDFKTLMNYSLIAVFLVLFAFFRRFELALLGVVPILLTGIVTTGFVYLLNLELNIFSTIVTTLILGIGVDFSIFMTSGLQKLYTTGKNELSIYRTSIILAVLTTLLSIGVLVFAKHPALHSISWVSLIGILSAMLITFTFYPLFFKFFIANRPRKGNSPVSLRLVLTSVFSHTYFALGSLLFTVFVLFLPLLPIAKVKKQKWIRKLSAKFFKSVLYTNHRVKKTVRNPHQETFEKPAIIIANHTSFLDTLSTGFFPTDFTFLVNDWVFKSPIFGKVVRFAGYQAASNGFAQNEEELVKMIKNGTSLVIFPEGTRSMNGAIGRFHKGAFLLAQKYQIDIVPIYIHGNADSLPKGDFIIYDGVHTLEIGERIVMDEAIEKMDNSAFTKMVSQRFRERYQAIRKEGEGVDYFAKKIHLNFLYKEKDTIESAQREFETNKHLYYAINPWIPNSATVLRIGDDLGIWDLMLVLRQGRRKVQSYLMNEQNRGIARQSYLLQKRNLSYLDELPRTSVDVLLLTTEISEETLNFLMENVDFKRIISVQQELPAVFQDARFELIEQTEKFRVINVK